MQQYILKDKYNYDFIISRVSEEEYRIKFYHHCYREQYMAIYSREQLRKKTQQKDCVFKNEIMKCFELGLLDKLTPCTEYDDTMKYMMLVIDSFSNLTQTIRDGKIIYELSEVDGNLFKMRLQKLGEVLGIQDVEVYRKLRSSGNDIKNNTNDSNNDTIFTGHYDDNGLDIDVEG